MKCFNHKRKAAVGQCISCSKGICDKCAIEIDDHLYCKKCVSKQKKSPSKEIKKGRSVTGDRKNPTLAIIIGLLIGLLGFAGVGQIYVGKTMRGIVILVIGWVLVGANLLSSLLIVTLCLSVPISLIFILWQAVDAMELAKKYNRELEQTGSAPW